MPPHAAHASHDHAAHDHASPALAALLDLDATVLAAYWREVVAWVGRRAAGTRLHRILDVGAGTGTGTVALAQRFGDAHVLAADRSEEMLARVRATALDLGLAGRVGTVRTDLDASWPDLGAVDLAWASMSLHEMADPDAVLAEAFGVLRPGGLLAVVELDAPVRFLPDDLGRGTPGLESRCLAALAAAGGHALPFGSDWRPHLEKAGFVVEDARSFDLDPGQPTPADTGRYAQGWFTRVRETLADRLDPDDLATLDALLDPHDAEGLLRRTDLHPRGSRTGWLARRPLAPVG